MWHRTVGSATLVKLTLVKSTMRNAAMRKAAMARATDTKVCSGSHNQGEAENSLEKGQIRTFLFLSEHCFFQSESGFTFMFPVC